VDEMDNLKKLIKSVENKSEAISKKINMVNEASKRSGYLISASNGYYQVQFTDKQQEKIGALIESFIKEETLIRDPLADTLNTISKLIGRGE
jgi:hypothetical protein